MTLLAKRRAPGRPPVTLQAHSYDAEAAAAHLFRADSRWGEAFPSLFRLPRETHETWLMTLRVAALFHDLGKANEDFLAMLSGQRLTQTIRHEHLSALILCRPEIRSWLGAQAKDGTRLDLEAITAAVLCHHLKATADGKWTIAQARSVAGRVPLRLDHRQIKAVLTQVGEVASLGPAPELNAPVWSAQTWAPEIRALRDAARRLPRDLRRNLARGRFVAALKAGLIVADSVASGLVREGHSLTDWIESNAHGPALSPPDLSTAILTPRAEQVERRTGTPFQWHPFQIGAAELGPRALLIAGCGTGKTLAAWRWAQRRLGQRPAGRVLFLYPTRATATEGFRDYAGWAPQGQSLLLHGTARYELEAMLENPPESLVEKSPGLSEAEARLFALGAWSRRYFSATVDQFLGFLECDYKGLCMLPVLADSVVIFDEVHSFDHRLFGKLLVFLRELSVPALCMTATLQPERRRQLEDVGLEIYPSAPDPALQAREGAPRYRLRMAELQEAMQAAVETYRRGHRVLWVVNVVRRAQEIVTALRGLLDAEVICYHSRFRLLDRQRAHERAIAAFRDPGVPAIAVTTQVCEMSLDLDADLLVSELAPIPAMVQRLGRANRHQVRGAEFLADGLFYTPDSHLPYSEAEMSASQQFIQQVSAAPVSQRALADALIELSPPERAAEGASSFLEGGYYAERAGIRDIHEFTQPAILDTDLHEVQAALGARRPIDGWILPAPRGAGLQPAPAPIPRWLGVVDGQQYEPELGLRSA